MHIGIFGGSFNPIHNGHIALAKHIVSMGLVEEVWLMVSPHNPLKENRDLLNEDVRFNIAKKALQNIRGVKACNFEFKLPRPSYTWHTLETLRQRYPFHQFSIIIGADNWIVFNKWKNADKILKNHEIIIYPREDYKIDANNLPNNVHLIDAVLFPFSSTQIRASLKAQKDIREWLPESAYKEILTHYGK